MLRREPSPSPGTADRFGGCTLSVGAAVYAVGLALMAYASTPLTLHLTAGVLIGFWARRVLVHRRDRRVRTIAAGADTRLRRRHRRRGPFGDSSVLAAGGGLHRRIRLSIRRRLRGCRAADPPLALALAMPREAAATGAAAKAVPSVTQALGARRSVIAATCCSCSASSPAASRFSSSPCMAGLSGRCRADRRRTLGVIRLFNIVGAIGAGWLSAPLPKRYILLVHRISRWRSSSTCCRRVPS